MAFNDGDVLTANQDAATYYMGESWRTPTVEEWQRIIDQCTITYNPPLVKIMGANGSDYVILPLPGWLEDNNNGEGTRGDYWASTYVGGDNPVANEAVFEYGEQIPEFYTSIFTYSVTNPAFVRAIKLIPKN